MARLILYSDQLICWSEYHAKSIFPFIKLVEILAIDQKIIDPALSSEFSDFEDSIQYYTAIENGIKILITRNDKDYELAQIRIFRPTEFLAEL